MYFTTEKKIIDTLPEKRKKEERERERERERKRIKKNRKKREKKKREKKKSFGLVFDGLGWFLRFPYLFLPQNH